MVAFRQVPGFFVLSHVHIHATSPNFFLKTLSCRRTKLTAHLYVYLRICGAVLFCIMHIHDVMLS